MCIGSCIAPIISDLYLAAKNRNVALQLEGSKVTHVLSYVDDFLVLIDANGDLDRAVSTTLQVFTNSLKPLVITHEIPERESIRFLDLRLRFSDKHVCWECEPRSMKPLLPHSSGHSKLVKRGIVNLCLKNARLTNPAFTSASTVCWRK